MKNTGKNAKRSAAERKINMAEHAYRVKAMGLSERAVKMLIRILIILVPVILIAVWFLRIPK
jgi:cell division septal protein FtsQ